MVHRDLSLLARGCSHLVACWAIKAPQYFDCYNGESICLSFLFQGKRKGSKPKKIAVHKHFSSADYIDEDDDELMLLYFEEYGAIALSLQDSANDVTSKEIKGDAHVQGDAGRRRKKRGENKRYIFTFAIGAGPVTGLIIPELSSAKMRGKIMGFSFSVHWVGLLILLTGSLFTELYEAIATLSVHSSPSTIIYASKLSYRT
ncbi:hypothetical protein Peur_011007 [Populus x canadensis]